MVIVIKQSKKTPCTWGTIRHKEKSNGKRTNKCIKEREFKSKHIEQWPPQKNSALQREFISTDKLTRHPLPHLHRHPAASGSKLSSVQHEPCAVGGTSSCGYTWKKNACSKIAWHCNNPNPRPQSQNQIGSKQLQILIPPWWLTNQSMNRISLIELTSWVWLPSSVKAWPQDPHEWQHGLSCKAPQSVNTMESRLFVVHEEFEELESLRGFWIRLLESKDLIITIKIRLFMLLQCHQIGCHSIKKKFWSLHSTVFAA